MYWKLHGKEKPNSDVARALNYLARALQARGDRESLNEAIGLFGQSLTDVLETPRQGETQLRRGQGLNNLAAALKARGDPGDPGDLDEAIRLWPSKASRWNGDSTARTSPTLTWPRGSITWL